MSATSAVRTLFLHRDLPFHGGVAQSFLNYARHHDGRAVQMWVGSFVAATEELRSSFVECSVTPITLGDTGYTGPVMRLRNFLTKESIQVVVCGSFKSYTVAKLAAVATSCRVLFWIPGIHLVIQGSGRRLLLRLLGRHDTFVYISTAVAKAHSYDWHKGRELVVFHGIDDPFQVRELLPYDRSHRSEFGLTASDFVVGCTAEFIALKDHATLLGAFDVLAAEIPASQLVLIGTGEMLSETRAAVSEKAWSHRVHFLGPRTDARRLLGILDVHVQPSRGEGFGLAVAEAMLAGLPVVTTNEGAFPEYVVDGRTGFTFEGGNHSQLASILSKLATSPDLRHHIGQEGREHALSRFSPRRFAEELTAVITAEARQGARGG